MILCWSGVSSTVAAGEEEILSARSATAAGVLNTDIRGNVDCNVDTLYVYNYIKCNVTYMLQSLQVNFSTC